MSYKDKYEKYKQKYTEAAGIQKYKDMVGGDMDIYQPKKYDFEYRLPNSPEQNGGKNFILNDLK